jgi:hypothetical protein
MTPDYGVYHDAKASRYVTPSVGAHALFLWVSAALEFLSIPIWVSLLPACVYSLWFYDC